MMLIVWCVLGIFGNWLVVFLLKSKLFFKGENSIGIEVFVDEVLIS